MKKILSVILALMMFVLPISSMAESKTLEVSAQHGSLTELLTAFGVLPSDTDADDTATSTDADSAAGSTLADAINDMIDSVRATFYMQEDTLQAGGALYLGDQQIISADVAMDGGTLKIASNLLGEDVISVNLSDIISQITSQIASQTDFSAVVELFTTLASMDFSDFTLTNTMAVINDLTARLNDGASEVTEQPVGCDPASVKIDFALTGSDMTNLFTALIDDALNCASIRSLAESNLAEGTTLEDQRAQLISSLNDTYGQMADLVYEVYLDDNGELVACNLTMSSNGTPVTAAVTRNTADGQVVYLMEETVDGATLTMTLTKTETGASLQISMPVNGENFTMGGAYEASENETQLTLNIGLDSIGLALIADSQATETGKIATASLCCTGTVADYLSTPVLLSVQAVESTADDVAAISGNVVDLTSMSAEDLESWYAGVGINALITLLAAVDNLPSSVLSLFLGI